jgi:hypothetical protein
MAENMPCYASQLSDCNVGGILARDLYQFASFQLRDYNNRNETTILLFSLFITSLKILYQSPPLRAVELTKHKTNPLPKIEQLKCLMERKVLPVNLKAP